MKATFDDLVELSPDDALLRASQEYAHVDAYMKVARKRRQYAREKMISHLIETNREGVKTEGFTASLRRKLGPKIEDAELLKEHIHNLEEPDSTFLEEVFIRPNQSRGIEDPLDILIERAVEMALKTGTSVEDCLPPGLGYGYYDKLTVRLKSSPQFEEDIQQVDNPYAELDKALGGDR